MSFIYRLKRKMKSEKEKEKEKRERERSRGRENDWMNISVTMISIGIKRCLNEGESAAWESSRSKPVLTAIGKPGLGLVGCKYWAVNASAWKKSSPFPPRWEQACARSSLCSAISLRCNNESRWRGPPLGIGWGVNGYSKKRCSPPGVNVGVWRPTVAGM